VSTAKDGGVKSESAVEMHGVTFSYDGVPVLEDVHLSIEEGDFVGVVGPNGGGKTTLLRIILGLLTPQRGSVEVLGETAASARPRIGYMPQHSALDLKFPVSVFDVVLLGRLGKGRTFGPFGRADKQAAAAALEELEAGELRNRPFEKLSGGQRQRVLIARALASAPEMLLLDEPTASLDIQMEGELYELLRKLNQRLTIVMVSHDLGVVSKNVRKVVCVKRKVATHPTGELTGDIIREMYGDVCIVRHDQVTGQEEISCPNL
jgi:zinc transport system ATP-binding protein